MGTELPESINARCYTAVAIPLPYLRACEVPSFVIGLISRYGDHGAKVAEAIIDVAPEASL